MNVVFLFPRIRYSTGVTLKKRSILRIVDNHVALKRLMPGKLPLWTFRAGVLNLSRSLIGPQVNRFHVTGQAAGTFQLFPAQLTPQFVGTRLSRVQLEVCYHCVLAQEPFAT
jgi:hypothetical protein